VGQYVLDSVPATDSKALVFGRADPLPAATPAAEMSATGTILLTDTEKQVLSLLAQGVEENGLALRMAVPDSMVSKAMADLYSKFNVTSRNELVTLAKQKQLV
jgi:DNA-binding NarL/FixJ family response regulator